MATTISKIGIRNASSTYDVRDIAAKGQNIQIGRDSDNNIIIDVDTTTPDHTQTLTEALKNIEVGSAGAAPNSHAWTDSETGHGIADSTHYGHVKVGTGLAGASGTISVTYGTAEGTACEGNDGRLSDDRKNPNKITFNDGTSYDGSSEVTGINYSTVGAAPSAHTSTAASSSILGHVKIGTGLEMNAGTVSVSYGAAAGTACQGNDSRLTNTRTPITHAASSTTYGGGTEALFGHVKLSDIYNNAGTAMAAYGAATSVGASAYALQSAYNDLYNLISGTEVLKIESVTAESDGTWTGTISSSSKTLVNYNSGRDALAFLEPAIEEASSVDEIKKFRKVYSFVKKAEVTDQGALSYSIKITFYKDPSSYLPVSIKVRGVKI